MNTRDTTPLAGFLHTITEHYGKQAFRHLKGDLALRPIQHQDLARIQSHIYISFLACCLHVTLARRLHDRAPGLTPRSIPEKLGAIPMLDVHLPATNGREVILTRHTQPEPDQRLLLDKLKLKLPEQPPPRITAAQVRAHQPAQCRLFKCLPSFAATCAFSMPESAKSG